MITRIMGLVRVTANAEPIEQTREDEFADEKEHNAHGDVGDRQPQHRPASQQWKRRLGNLIETRRPTARRETQATLHEAGEKIARHRSASDHSNVDSKPTIGAHADVTGLDKHPRIVFDRRGAGAARRMPDAAIEGIREAVAQNTFCDHRRSVGYQKENEKLEDYHKTASVHSTDQRLGIDRRRTRSLQIAEPLIMRNTTSARKHKTLRNYALFQM